jgi:predicted DNA-binding transcriptional regulator AlpA
MDDSTQLLDIRGVALKLACSERQVRRLMNAGEIPAPVRLGGNVRWPLKSLSDWVGSGCPKTPPPA